MCNDESDDAIFQDNSLWAQTLMDDLEHEKRVELFKKAIKELPKEDQRLIELLYVRELPHQRAADILGKSIDAIYMQKKRLVEKMKILIGKYTKKKELRRR